MSAAQSPQDGVVYTPEQVSENRWLGNLSPGAIRRACNDRIFEHVKIQGKIGLTRANILAIQSKCFIEAASDRRSLPTPGRRHFPARSPQPADVAPFVPRPKPRRKAS